MYVIAVYDVAVERLNTIRNILKRYLNWIQNSAFEGELTEGMLEELSVKLSDAMDPDRDSLIFYTIPNPRWIKKKVLGKEKSEITHIL